MVAETQENMNKVFDCMNDGFRAAMDAGKRAQESWFKILGEKNVPTFDFANVVDRTDRFAKDFFPFMNKTMETITQSCDHSFRSGLDVVRTACDKPAEDGDFYANTRRFWDAAFDATRSNFETFSKASTKTADNFSAFCNAMCSCPEASGKNTTAKTK